MEHALLHNSMEHAAPGEHEEDTSMKVEVAFDGTHSPFRYRHKKRSKVWEEYKPIFLNGKVQFAECLYCHNRLSCKDSNGTSHLWRHQKICPGKDEAALRRQKDSYFPCVLVNESAAVTPHDPVSDIITETLSDINSVTPSGSRFTSKVWKEFTPIYVEGKLQAADCIHCNKRLSANKFGGRSHLSRHLITCAGRRARAEIHQKGLFYPSSLPSLKSRMQDELSPALTNGKVQIAEYSSKLLGTSSSGDFTPKPIQVVPAQHPLPTPDCTSLKRHRTSFETTLAGQETSDPELAGMIALHGYPLSIVEHEEMMRFVKKLNPVKLLSLTSVGEVRDDTNTSLLKEMLIEKNYLPIGGKLYNVACVDNVLDSIVFKVQSDILRLVGDMVMNFLVSLTQQQLLEVISQLGLKCPQEDAKWWHKIYFRLEVLLHFKKSFSSEERVSSEDTKIAESYDRPDEDMK
uniref:BED-type domain-containing protein n=1 Tax=Leersia perrieri TaxID=77586 RepID=A0A0D9W9W3_9ORYZ